MKTNQLHVGIPNNQKVLHDGWHSLEEFQNWENMEFTPGQKETLKRCAKSRDLYTLHESEKPAVSRKLLRVCALIIAFFGTVGGFTYAWWGPALHRLLVRMGW